MNMLICYLITKKSYNGVAIYRKNAGKLRVYAVFQYRCIINYSAVKEILYLCEKIRFRSTIIRLLG